MRPPGPPVPPPPGNDTVPRVGPAPIAQTTTSWFLCRLTTNQRFASIVCRLLDAWPLYAPDANEIRIGHARWPGVHDAGSVCRERAPPAALPLRASITGPTAKARTA